MQRFRFALYSQLSLGFYFQMIQWIPLGKWNYQPQFQPLIVQAYRRQLDLTDLLFVCLFMVPTLLFYIAYRKQWLWLMWTCVIGNVVWLALEIQTWWVAYIFGASNSWMDTYQRVFSQSTKILPSFGRHLPPDAMHFVLQVLLAIALLVTTQALLNARSTKNSDEGKR